MVPEPCQQVWVSYGGTGDHASVSWGALRLNECHPLRVLRIEKPTFSKQSNLSVLWAELPSLWKEITFFTCSCWVHTPVDRTKKLLMNMWNWLKKKIRLLNVCVRIYVWTQEEWKEWEKISISSPCLFVVRGVRTHHVVYAVQMVELKRWERYSSLSLSSHLVVRVCTCVSVRDTPLNKR